ncbi:MAG: phenylpropionate dioxygenase-like ring-hydroxylating dioxygenase large terminal subunit [Alphaproteobacteria bacterium]|jgi:choline monooxygenase
MTQLLSDNDVIERIFGHIDNKTTDLGDRVWREPADNYRSVERFDAEIKLLRRLPVAYCPSAALPKKGSYVARTAAATPLVAVRGEDGIVRTFRNACRHRGMAVVDGDGCAKSLTCPYHAWTYGLDGQLKYIPGEEGFPGLDQKEHGLVPVTTVERGGLVFVTQDDPIAQGALEDLPELIAPEQVVFDKSEIVDEANWKLIGETSMEGYHIKSLHNESFYPHGFDNINVVETFGANSRIVFPFRRIEKLRDIPVEKRRIQGMITDVYQLFPNTHISVLSNHSIMVILEPVTPTQTKWEIFRLSNKSINGAPVDMTQAKLDAGFVNDTGLVEDRQAACSIQAGLEANANSHFTFGHFEKATVHFHATLDEMLAKQA